jgi:hypothetical protein
LTVFRLLLAFFPLALLALLVAQLNHALAPWHVYLSVGGLLVVFPALRIDWRTGFAAVFLAGLFADSGEPVRFGTHAFLFATAYAFLFFVRNRLPREETLLAVMLALLANLGIFLAFSLLLIGRSPAPSGAWARLLVDLLCSQAFLALVAPWFFALQARAFAFSGFELQHRSRRFM